LLSTITFVDKSLMDGDCLANTHLEMFQILIGPCPPLKFVGSSSPFPWGYWLL